MYPAADGITVGTPVKVVVGVIELAVFVTGNEDDNELGTTKDDDVNAVLEFDAVDEGRSEDAEVTLGVSRELEDAEAVVLVEFSNTNDVDELELITVEAPDDVEDTGIDIVVELPGIGVLELKPTETMALEDTSELKLDTADEAEGRTEVLDTLAVVDEDGDTPFS